MRSYGQFCGVARALDVVGDRWSLLVMRELLLRDCRFTDLRDGLPGIATNLLTQRLRDLEAEGLLERVEAPPPVATTLYRATPRGRALWPVMRELVRWAFPLMVPGRGDDAARGRWLLGAARAFYDGVDLAELAPLVVLLEADGEALTLEVGTDGVLVPRLGGHAEPDVTVRGSMEAVVRRLAGAEDGEDPVEVDGDAAALGRLGARATFGEPVAA